MRRLLLALCLLLLGVAAGAQDFIRYYPPQIGTTSSGAFTFTGPILLPDGTAAAPGAAFASDSDGTGTGYYRISANIGAFSSNGAGIFGHSSNSGIGLQIGSAYALSWPSSGLLTGGTDLVLTRGGAATLQLGAADAAAPVNQTLQAQGVAAGTSDVSGANLTITSGNGRGNAAGSNLIFQTPTGVGSGSGAQTMTARLTIAAGSVTAVQALITPLVRVTDGNLTAGTMAVEVFSLAKTLTHSYTWTNAMLTAGAAATTWDVTVATLPAKTQVIDTMVVITAAQTSAGTLSVQCGDDATFVNYVLAGNAKAAANTVYGDVVAERGTALGNGTYSVGPWLPSYTGTTAVKCRFISDSAMSTMTASTGRVILTTRLLP